MYQGYSDSRGLPDDLPRFSTDLAHVFVRFRQDLGADLPIVAGHIRELTDADKEINRMLDELAEEDRRLAVVPTRDLEFAPDRDGTPDVHIALSGCHELGRRMVAAYETMPRDR